MRKLKKRPLKPIDLYYYFILLSFFRPQSLTMFGDSSKIAFYFQRLLIISTISVSLYYVVIGIKRVRHSKMLQCISLMIMVETIVSILNRSLDLSTFMGSLAPVVGFAFFLKREFDKKGSYFIEVAFTFFEVLSIIGAFLILVFPNGFNKALSKWEAIYFLGSKNASFFYYFMFLFLDLIRKDNKKNYKIRTIIYLILLYSLFVCDCVNGGILFIICVTYWIVEKYQLDIRKLITPKFMLTSLAIVIIMVLLAINGRNFGFLGYFGRDTSFSGRVGLWTDAIEKIIMHPLIGNGIDVKFRLNAFNLILQNQAHNIYLDIAARFGLIVLSIFVSFNMITLIKTNRYRKNRKAIILCVGLVIMLVHSMFDYAEMHYFVFFALLGEYYQRTIGCQIRHQK